MILKIALGQARKRPDVVGNTTAPSVHSYSITAERLVACALAGMQTGCTREIQKKNVLG